MSSFEHERPRGAACDKSVGNSLCCGIQTGSTKALVQPCFVLVTGGGGGWGGFCHRVCLLKRLCKVLENNTLIFYAQCMPATFVFLKERSSQTAFLRKRTLQSSDSEESQCYGTPEPPPPPQKKYI